MWSPFILTKLTFIADFNNSFLLTLAWFFGSTLIFELISSTVYWVYFKFEFKWKFINSACQEVFAKFCDYKFTTYTVQTDYKPVKPSPVISCYYSNHTIVSWYISTQWRNCFFEQWAWSYWQGILKLMLQSWSSIIYLKD